MREVDAQGCEEILALALEGILAKRPGIVAAIGEHELNTVNQAVYEAVNLELDEWQKANIQYVSELSIKLQEKGEELVGQLRHDLVVSRYIELEGGVIFTVRVNLHQDRVRIVTLPLRARFLQVCNLTQKGFPRCLERRKFTHVILSAKQ